jgi:aspartyl-tRNA(Asn)/glutamyl-tRNA(Gln) amidotransferase subunit C
MSKTLSSRPRPRSRLASSTAGFRLVAQRAAGCYLPLPLDRPFPLGGYPAVSLDRNTVRTIAQLARIRVADEQLDVLAGELSGIIQWVEQLAELDTTGVEPMTSVTAMTLQLRADDVTDGGVRDAVLANAPETVEGFYAVPKVVE